MIENIEKVAAKFEVWIFSQRDRQRKIFHQTRVQIPITRAAKDISAGVSKLISSGACKRCGVKPMGNRLLAGRQSTLPYTVGKQTAGQ